MAKLRLKNSSTIIFTKLSKITEYSVHYMHHQVDFYFNGENVFKKCEFSLKVGYALKWKGNCVQKQ